jgi:hypothetical protein
MMTAVIGFVAFDECQFYLRWPLISVKNGENRGKII